MRETDEHDTLIESSRTIIDKLRYSPKDSNSFVLFVDVEWRKVDVLYLGLSCLDHHVH